MTEVPDLADEGVTRHIGKIGVYECSGHPAGRDGGEGGLSKDLMAMKVTELKEELAAREEPVSGNKAWLRRQLHAAIVRDHLEVRDAEGA